MKSFNISRRSFLKRCSIVAAMTGVPVWFVERQLAAAETAPRKRPGPNDRPRIALVGCGGQGKGITTNAANHGDIVAVCDVDQAHAAEAAAKFTVEGRTAPQIYGDFRKVLERGDVDVILNATPDHWHTLVNLGAVKAGLDIYSEKPLTLTIDEGRRLVTAARARATVLQTGTQQRSSQQFRLACELVRNGRLGKLLEAKVWLPAGLREGPFAPAATPAVLDWDYWLGQAARVDFVPQRAHRTFRFWYDYSGGTMTDWGAHHNDIAYWAIGQLAPRTVASTVLATPIPGGYTAISEYEVRYVYADGTKLTILTTKDDSIYGAVINKEGQRNGIRFTGTEGVIDVGRGRLTASDPALIKTPLPEGSVQLQRSSDHMQNFMDCVRSRSAPICDVETGHRSATMCHLGAISLRTGRSLTWDATAEKFTGEHAAEGNAHIAREMRAPYDYSFVS